MKIWGATVAIILLASGCDAPPEDTAPDIQALKDESGRIVTFAGLPLAGNMKDAKQAGFTDCDTLDHYGAECRRDVTAFGVPVKASVYLRYPDSIEKPRTPDNLRFDEVALWFDTVEQQYEGCQSVEPSRCYSDRNAPLTLFSSALLKDGWRSVGRRWGDEYVKAELPVILTINNLNDRDEGSVKVRYATADEVSDLVRRINEADAKRDAQAEAARDFQTEMEGR